MTFEVVVVDNNSRDDSVAAVRCGFPEVRLIESRVSQGYTPNMNIALRAATGQYVALLNDDTLLTGNTFGAMTAFLAANPGFGAVGPKVLNADGSFQGGPRGPVTLRTLAYCELYLDRLFPNSRTFAAFSMTYWDPECSVEMDTASGSCLLARRAVFEQVGLLEERIPIGPDDIDLSLRLRAAGWRLYYLADASVVQYKSVSRQRIPTRGVVQNYEGRYWMVAHHFGARAASVYRFCVVVSATLRMAYSVLCLLEPRARARRWNRITSSWQILRRGTAW